MSTRRALTRARQSSLTTGLRVTALLGGWLPRGPRDAGELDETTEDEPVAVTPVQLIIGDGQSELREAGEQRTQRELAFHARQGGPEAEVDAVPEREVMRVASFEVERLR